MKKNNRPFCDTFSTLILVCNSLAAIELLKGKTLYMQAQTLEKNADYFKALELYKQARQELLKVDDIVLANQCRQSCNADHEDNSYLYLHSRRRPKND